MAQYFEDWSGSTIGLPPSGWTRRFVNAGVTDTVVSDTDAVAPAGKRLQIVMSATASSAVARRFLSFDQLDGDADRAHLKIAVIMKQVDVAAAAQTTIGMYPGGRGSNLTASASITFAGGGRASSSGARVIKQVFYVNGAATQNTGVIDTSTTTGEAVVLRLSLSLSHAEVTLARYSDPSTILFTNSFTTGAVLSAGWGGLFTFATALTWDIYAVGFGTNGDEAPLSAVGAGQTISADVGTFLLTGQAAIFDVGMPLSAGAFALTGQDVSFSQGTNMSADVGTMLLTGQDAAFDVALTAAAGSFALTGQDATLTDDTPQDRTITADSGTFLMTGQDVAFSIGLTSGAGSYAESGQDGVLNVTMIADAGSFAFTGQDVDLVAEVSYTMSADAGSFILTGQDVAFILTTDDDDVQDQGAGGGGAGGDYWDQREKYLKYLKETYNTTVKKKETVREYVSEDKPKDFEYLRNVEVLIAQKAESRIEFNRAVSNVIELSEIIDKLNRQQYINDIITVLLLDS